MILRTTIAAAALMLAPAAQAAPLGQALPSLAPLVEAVRPCVVGVTSRQMVAQGSGDPGQMREFMERFYGGRGPMPESPQVPRTGIGSGFIVDPKGIILTNNHVVEGADEVTIKTSDGTEHAAEVLGTDPETDIAVVQIKDLGGKQLPAARLGSSDALRVGDWVVAIGNPFGLETTVTSGIISAKARHLHAGPYDDFLQTDAAINPGNSGGPLFDLSGNVVGINTAIVGSGIGFAVPIDLAKALLPQLIAKGKVSRGYIGVSIQDITPELSRAFDVSEKKGALVASVEPTGPGARAGLKPGDLIVRLQDQTIAGAEDLTRLVATFPPGKQVDLALLRAGKPLKVGVKLGERPSDLGRPGRNRPESGGTSSLGLSLQPVPAEIQNQLGIRGGAMVAQVAPGSRAEAAGLQQNDIVVEANRKPVNDPGDLVAAARGAGNQPLLLRVMRGGGGAVYVVVPPEPARK